MVTPFNPRYLPPQMKPSALTNHLATLGYQNFLITPQFVPINSFQTLIGKQMVTESHQFIIHWEALYISGQRITDAIILLVALVLGRTFDISGQGGLELFWAVSTRTRTFFPCRTPIFSNLITGLLFLYFSQARFLRIVYSRPLLALKINMKTVVSLEELSIPVQCPQGSSSLSAMWLPILISNETQWSFVFLSVYNPNPSPSIISQAQILPYTRARWY